MDFLKAKIYLDKLNREYARMSKDPENTVRIDVDIMGSYIRELYDAILTEPNTYTAPTPELAPVRTQHRSPVVEPVMQIAPPPPPPPAVAEVPPPAAPPPVREEPPAPAPPPPPVEAPRPASPSHAAHSPTGLEVLFEEKQAKELAEKLAETPISDLKKAIPLNDRLLYTSELFAGDGKAFEEALATLNTVRNFEEARDFLIQSCAVYYTWTEKKRVDTAKALIKLVRRRHK
ncbi:MAG: hypothetical protein Q7T20_15110 [Saprospiraceae bacterium]|nr:hypothetical protein [Saprospiraceae bacterium]